MVTRKPLDLPPEVAQGFVRAMRGYFAESDTYRRDAIAAHQLSVLRDYQSPREKPLRLDDIKVMFKEMRAIVG